MILDELEKVGDKDVLNLLLSIWESGQFSFLDSELRSTDTDPPCLNCVGTYTSRRDEQPIDASK